MKVDTTKIEGYSEMSAEEKLQALENFEIQVPENNEENLKKLLSKRNSEIATLNKQLEDRMSEAEKAEAKRQQLEAEKDAKIAELEKIQKLGTYSNAYLEQGYSKEEASKMASLLYEGDLNGLFAMEKLHIDNIAKQAVADAITKNHLSVGEPPKKTDDDTALRRAMGLPV